MSFKIVSFAISILLIFISCPSIGQKSENIHVDGLRDSVEVYRDNWGINHIYANNEHDLFFAQGYCAARDRLFQFEIWRRQATGTMAELFGVSELKRDIGARLFKYRGDMQKELNHYHPRGISIINAFVDGINAYINDVKSNPELLPIEFKLLGIEPHKWTPEVVISRHQGLLGNAETELNIGRAVAVSNPEIVKDLMYFHPKQPDLNLDPSITKEMLDEDILSLYKAWHSSFRFNKENGRFVINSSAEKSNERDDGSNNWIVSGSRTKSGFPHLANDPHRQISLPSLRYSVHLSAPGWNVIGGGEPVLPGVSIGHNEFGAWGLTIFRTDFEDLYVYDLNPRNLSQYKYKGQWVDMYSVREKIAVREASPQSVDLYFTLHGPVVYIDSVRKKGYALRCAWLEPGGAPYLASLRFDQAKNWDEFREATKYSNIPGENMIWADRNKDIGWQAVGISPIRRNFSGMVPVPGDGQFEWDGYLPILERPHMLNPKEGFFETSNQDVTPESYEHWDAIGYTWSDSYRGRRITEVLTGNSSVTLQNEQNLQTDYFSIPARELIPLLKGLKLKSKNESKARDMLFKWNFYLSHNSIEAGIYAMWERQLLSLAASETIPDNLRGLVDIQLEKLVLWLKNTESDNSVSFNPIKDKNKFLTTSFEKAISELEIKLGNNIKDWQYGQPKYKHISFEHPMSLFLSGAQKNEMNLGPLPRGGNSYTPNVTGGTDNQRSGASFRIIMDIGDWDKTVMTNVPGQSGDPRSKFYSNLFESWAKDEYFPAYFSKEKIRENTHSKMLMIPKF